MGSKEEVKWRVLVEQPPIVGWGGGLLGYSLQGLTFHLWNLYEAGDVSASLG